MTSSSRAGRRHAARTIAPKVPEITAIFWVVKILTTGMGEAASDFLANKSVPVAAAAGLLGLVVGLTLQLRARRYTAGVYWFAVAMVAVFGTMAADGFHKLIGLPYAVVTAGYAIALAVILYLWNRDEGTLSIHSITSQRREIYYWLTVLATFALGTAAGDLSAFTLNLGYFASVVLYGLVILVPLVGYRMRWMGEVTAFWFAYILTRPLGASMADWLGKERDKHGLGYGDGTVTVVAMLLIVVLVSYLAWTGVDVQRAPEPTPATRPTFAAQPDPVPAPAPRPSALENPAVPSQYGEAYRDPAGTRPASADPNGW